MMDTALSYTPDPNAFQVQARAPFVIQLLILFLAWDACERIGELIWVAWQASHSLEPPATPYPAPIPVTMLWIVVDMLLPVLLLLRTTAGRLLTQVIFGIHLIYLAHVFVLKHPYLWLYMGSLGPSSSAPCCSTAAPSHTYVAIRQELTSTASLA
jgi:hypothetical protein